MSQLVTYDWSPVRTNSPKSKVFKGDFTPKLKLDTQMTNSPDVLPQKLRPVSTSPLATSSTPINHNKGFFRFVKKVKDKHPEENDESGASAESTSSHRVKSDLASAFDDLEDDDDLFPDKSLEVQLSQMPLPVPNKIETKKTTETVTKKEFDAFDESSDQIFMDLQVDELIAQSQKESEPVTSTKNSTDIQMSSSPKTFVRHHTMPGKIGGGKTISMQQKIQTKSFERHTSMPGSSTNNQNQFSNFRTSNSVESVDSSSSSG